jgi:hypothetical protein
MKAQFGHISEKHLILDSDVCQGLVFSNKHSGCLFSLKKMIPDKLDIDEFPF